MAALNAFSSVEPRAVGLQRSESAAISVAAAASHQRSLILSASEAAGSAIDAAAQNGGSKGFEEILGAFSGDAGQFDQRFEPVTLANQQLWPMPIPLVPDWVDEGWKALKVDLLSANENWEVWTSWYEDRMFGNTTDTALEVARAAEVPDSAWRAGPKSANAFIQQQLRGVYLKSGDGSDPPDPKDTVGFQQWLTAKPQEWATVIAVRAVLRMLATLAASPGDTTLLAIFRAISAARYAVLHPEYTRLANDAAEFLRDHPTQMAISAFYAASAVGAVDAPSRAVTIISDLGHQLDPTRTAAILRDALALVHGTPPTTVAFF